jgi:hypothetical protein
MSQPDIVTISSYNSPENQTAGSFDSNLANTIVGCKKFIITKFVMPNLMPDISPYYNTITLGVFNSSPNTAFYPLKLEIASNRHWATGQAFSTYLQGLVSNLLVTSCQYSQVDADLYQVVYDSETGLLTFDGSSITNTPLIWFTPWNVPDPISAKSALYKLGFTETNTNLPGYSEATQTEILTASAPLNLLSTAVIYVSSNLLGNANNDYRGNDGTPAGNESIICAIPVTSNFGTLISYQDQFSHFIDTNINSIRTVQIQLLDEEYNQLSLPKGCYCTIELRMLY